MDKIIVNEKAHTDLLTSDFYYDLPEELIAQYPSERRDGCRLMILDREKKTVEHKIFSDIVDYLKEGDVLVINNSKVIPARREIARVIMIKCSTIETIRFLVQRYRLFNLKYEISVRTNAGISNKSHHAFVKLTVKFVIFVFLF